MALNDETGLSAGGSGQPIRDVHGKCMSFI